MPQAACLSALVVARNHIYAVGGTTDMITASKQLCRYDAETDKWTELSPMIETRFDAGKLISVEPNLEANLFFKHSHYTNKGHLLIKSPIHCYSSLFHLNN